MWWYRRQSTAPIVAPVAGNCTYSPTSRGGFAKGCTFFKESSPSSTLTLPPPQPYLLNFTQASQGAPWCVPTWYALRYVDSATGEYGPLSAWTRSPVVAGSTLTAQACPHGKCYFSDNGVVTPPGPGTCTFSTPVVGVVEALQYSPETDGVWVNVHRQSTTLDPSSEGTIVGYLLPQSYTTPVGWNSPASFQDVLFSSIQTQGECKGC